MCLGQVKHTGGKQQGRSGTAATAHPAKRPRLGSASASAAPQTQPLPELATVHATSGGDSRDGSPAASASSGPFSGRRLLFWRLKHGKPLVEKV